MHRQLLVGMAFVCWYLTYPFVYAAPTTPKPRPTKPTTRATPGTCAYDMCGSKGYVALSTVVSHVYERFGFSVGYMRIC